MPCLARRSRQGSARSATSVQASDGHRSEKVSAWGVTTACRSTREPFRLIPRPAIRPRARCQSINIIVKIRPPLRVIRFLPDLTKRLCWSIMRQPSVSSSILSDPGKDSRLQVVARAQTRKKSQCYHTFPLKWIVRRVALLYLSVQTSRQETIIMPAPTGHFSRSKIFRSHLQNQAACSPRGDSKSYSYL